ncbi:MAG: FHA domain-containing protein [Lachnospiraceae bacterium]|nr:FHA domain-containing protein [Lachnospiraceae bacterium]
MGMILTVYDGNNASMDYDLDSFHKDVIGFGRQSDCDIILKSSFVSRLHGCIYKENGSWYIKDLDSSYGLSYNGNRIGNMKLNGGEHIRIFNNNGEYSELIFREKINYGSPENVQPNFSQLPYQPNMCQQNPYYVQGYGYPYTQPLGMKWYNFIIWFQLFAFTAICLYIGFWGIQLASIDNQIKHQYNETFGEYGDYMYELGNDLGINDYAKKQSDIEELQIIGIVVTFFAALFVFCALYVRHNLAKFKKGSPRDYLVLNGFFAVVYIICQAVLLTSYDSRAVDAGAGFIIFEIIGTIVYIYANSVYFKNRSHLFIN